MRIPRASASNRVHFVTGLILVLGLMASLWVFSIVRGNVLHDLVRDFQDEGASQVSSLTTYLNARLLFLDDLARHVELSSKPDPQDFRAFVETERTRVSGIQALEWAPMVMEADRSGAEAQIRNGHPGFTGFTERTGEGSLRSAQPRSTYYPVFFLDPLEGNEAALGYDLGSNPARLAAIEAARDSGQPKATEPITLVQETQRQAGFLIFVPVYGKGLPVSSLAQRRKAFHGVVLGVFRTEDLLTAALDGNKRKSVSGKLSDLDSHGTGGPLYTWNGGFSVAGPKPTSFASRMPLSRIPAYQSKIVFAGRTWEATFQPSPSFITNNLHLWVWAILPTGLLLTGLLALLFQLIIRRREQALRDSEKKFQTMFQSLAEGVALHELVRDAAGNIVNYRILEANPAYEAHTGLKAATVMGRLGTEAYGTEAPPYLDEFSKVAIDGTPYVFETYFPPMERHFRISVISPKAGQFATVFEDITDRKAHELELVRLNRLYDTLSHLGQTLIQVKSREGFLQDICTIIVERGGFHLAWVGWLDHGSRKILPVAKAGEAVAYLDGITVSADEIPEGQGPTGACIREGRPYVCQDFIHDPATEPWRAKAEHFGLHGSAAIPISLEGKVVGALMIYAKDPNIFQGRELALLKEIADTVSFGLSHLAAEENRQRLEAKAIRTQKLESLGTLAGGVAHNINNVLAVIMSTASAREMQTGSTDDLKAYRIIDRACKRGRDVVKSLMQFARPSLYNVNPVDLHALLSELHKLLESTHQNRVKVVEAFSSEPVWVQGNAGTLSSALMNLCLNAMDALPAGGTLTLRTTASVEGWAVLSVEDNGEGMTPEVLEKAMEPFFTTKEVGKGTGLGLSRAHGVIKAHGGILELSSQPGQGTVVAIRLPRIPTPVQAEALDPQVPDLGSLNILLVDDDEDVRILAAMMFKAGGLQATYAGGGEEAMEFLRFNQLPDLVILDHNMPGMDGAETLEAIRALHPDLPVLISSGRPDIEDWACYKRPNVAILSKPFNLAELRAKLAEMNLNGKNRT